MMEESGSSLAPKKKKTKINFSHVHQEFDHITIYNPRKEKDVPGSKSKSCGQDFLDRNSTNFIGVFHGVVGVPPLGQLSEAQPVMELMSAGRILIQYPDEFASDKPRGRRRRERRGMKDLSF